MPQEKPKVPVGMILRLIMSVIDMITASIEKSKENKAAKKAQRDADKAKESDYEEGK